MTDVFFNRCLILLIKTNLSLDLPVFKQIWDVIYLVLGSVWRKAALNSWQVNDCLFRENVSHTVNRKYTENMEIFRL